MATSGNKEKMIAFGEAERKIFHKIAKEHPAIAQMWLDKLEAMHWKNYLSKQEAEEITSKLINQNGRIGAHWGYDTLRTLLRAWTARCMRSLTTTAMRSG